MAYMKVLALELGSKGIRANCILPGMVYTPLIQQGVFDEEMLKMDMAKFRLSDTGRQRKWRT